MTRFERVGRLLAGVTVLNISTRRIGGLRWIKFGRLTIALCVSREYRPL
jgi:hypothetical protein